MSNIKKLQNHEYHDPEESREEMDVEKQGREIRDQDKIIERIEELYIELYTANRIPKYTWTPKRYQRQHHGRWKQHYEI